MRRSKCQVTASLVSLCMCIVIGNIDGAVAVAAEKAPIKPLCSFEPDEMAHLGTLKGVQAMPGEESPIAAPNDKGPKSGELLKKFATVGDYSMVCHANKGKSSTDDRHGCLSQYARLFGMNWVKDVLGSTDWSGYDYLWLDVTSPDSDAIPWLFIEDGKTFGPYVRFKISKGKTVTISMPLADVVKWAKDHGEGDMNLADIRSLYYFDETCEGNLSYVDNLRLATKAAPKPANMIEPFNMMGADQAWDDQVKKVAPAPKREIVREAGPIEQLGPITLPPVAFNTHSPRNGAFGEGGDAGTPNVRAVAAFDNRRIAVVLGQQWMLASFDGGKKWGSIDGKTDQATPCPVSHGHAGMGAGFYSGDIYFLARNMCNGGGGILRINETPIFLKGDAWSSGPTVLFDYHNRHCPEGHPIVFQCKSGRVWGFWDCGSVEGGKAAHLAKYSDDGGINWRYPGPFPEQIVRVPGSVAAEFRDAVAVFGENHGQYFDSKTDQFVKLPDLPEVCSVDSAAGTPEGNLAVAFKYDKRPGITLAHLEDKHWKLEVIDDGSTGESAPVALTASGSKIMAFWFRHEKDGYSLLYAVTGPDGHWTKPIEITRETEPVHRLVLPVVSPPDYAPVFWDHLVKGKPDAASMWVRFARVPSGKAWEMHQGR